MGPSASSTSLGTRSGYTLQVLAASAQSQWLRAFRYYPAAIGLVEADWALPGWLFKNAIKHQPRSRGGKYFKSTNFAA